MAGGVALRRERKEGRKKENKRNKRKRKKEKKKEKERENLFPKIKIMRTVPPDSKTNAMSGAPMLCQLPAWLFIVWSRTHGL